MHWIEMDLKIMKSVVRSRACDVVSWAKHGEQTKWKSGESSRIQRLNKIGKITICTFSLSTSFPLEVIAFRGFLSVHDDQASSLVHVVLHRVVHFLRFSWVRVVDESKTETKEAHESHPQNKGSSRVSFTEQRKLTSLIHRTKEAHESHPQNKGSSRVSFTEQRKLTSLIHRTKEAHESHPQNKGSSRVSFTEQHFLFFWDSKSHITATPNQCQFDHIKKLRRKPRLIILPKLWKITKADSQLHSWVIMSRGS